MSTFLTFGNEEASSFPKVRKVIQGEGMKKTTTSKQPDIRRAFCVVDLENLCQGSANVCELSQVARRAVDAVLSTFDSHITVVATGPEAIERTPGIFWDWKGCRFLTGHGLDGADRELLRVLDEEPAAAASSNVFIWSGDGIFAGAASRLRAEGCQVSVFGLTGGTSARLSVVANDVTEMPYREIDGYRKEQRNLLAQAERLSVAV